MSVTRASAALRARDSLLHCAARRWNYEIGGIAQIRLRDSIRGYRMSLLVPCQNRADYCA